MAGLLDFFGSGNAETLGLLGLSPEDIQKKQKDAQADALFALAGSLFKGGKVAPSILQGLQQGSQAYQGAMQAGLQEQLQKAQLQEMLKKRQQEQQSQAEQRRIQQIVQGAYSPEVIGRPAQMVEEDGRYMGETPAVMARAAGAGLTPQVINQLMTSEQGQAKLSQLAKLVPEMRKAGLGVEQKAEDNPFAIYLADPNLPASLKPIVQQYSKTWQNLDPAVVDTRVAQVGQMIQKQADFQQVQTQVKAQQDTLNAFKQQGLTQSAEAKALTASIALGNQQIARMLAEQKFDAAKNKPLPATLQKSEDEDLQAINSYKATQKELFSPIKALTPDPVTKKPMLVLGPIQNLRYEAANLTGDSTEASRAYADLQSSVKNAVNLKVSAEKGVQTDKDVLRFANALIAASGKNDTKATLEALNKFNESIATAQENTVKLIDQRRKSQGVAPLFGDTSRNVNVNY